MHDRQLEPFAVGVANMLFRKLFKNIPHIPFTKNISALCNLHGEVMICGSVSRVSDPIHR
jgi:hypothetical protein